MNQDLMDLIVQLQERYSIDQADIDVLVDAINETYSGPDNDVSEALNGQFIPEEEA